MIFRILELHIVGALSETRFKSSIALFPEDSVIKGLCKNLNEKH